MRLYHVTLLDKEEQERLRPKKPELTLENENVEEKRISLAPSILQCLQGIGVVHTFNEDFCFVRVYTLEIDEADENLISWKELYYVHEVDDSPLTQEYWYKEDITPIKCEIYAISGMKKMDYYLVSHDKEDKLKNEIKALNLYDENVEEMCATQILNEWLPQQNGEIQEKIFTLLTKTVEENTEEEAASFYKLYGKYPQMTREEPEFRKRPYLEACNIEKKDNMEVNTADDFQFLECSCEEIHQYKKDLKLLLCWELLDPDYVWKNDEYMYRITDSDGKWVAFFYYFIDENGKYTISDFEVLSGIRSRGIGEKIIRQFYEREGITGDQVYLEPLDPDAARFWRKCGVDCYCFGEEEDESF